MSELDDKQIQRARLLLAALDLAYKHDIGPNSGPNKDDRPMSRIGRERAALELVDWALENAQE